MNIFGKSLILNTNDVLKTVNAKLKITEVENEKKFVNETGDTITSLQITEEPKNDLDAVNLKYLKNVENDVKQMKTQIKIEMEKLINENVKTKHENENFKNGVSVLANQIKSQIEKLKGDVARHTVNELRIQTEVQQKLKNEFEIYQKPFKLLDKNVTIWYEKVEKRFNEINLPESGKKPLQLNDEEKVLLEKVQKKLIKESKNKLNLVDFLKEYSKKNYWISNHELEIFIKWFENEKNKTIVKKAVL